MPVRKCSNQKFRIGSGKCIYHSKEKAQKAYRGYLGSKFGSFQERISDLSHSDFMQLLEKILKH